MIIADTHVHLHGVFDVDASLDAAWEHFEAVRQGAGAKSFLGLLCLTDTSGRQADDTLCEGAHASGSWTFSRPAAGSAVCAERKGGDRLWLLPGRQIISRENLEVLALDGRLEVADRQHSLDALIDLVLAAGGIPVLPWAFGKWTGRRGREVSRLIHARRDYFVADNGNRWQGSSRPALLDAAVERGIPVLYGSDPLPFKGEQRRVGCCGIFSRGEAESTKPSECFRALLARPESWQFFGTGRALAPFACSMIRMQWRKWH